MQPIMQGSQINGNSEPATLLENVLKAPHLVIRVEYLQSLHGHRQLLITLALLLLFFFFRFLTLVVLNNWQVLCLVADKLADPACPLN